MRIRTIRRLAALALAVCIALSPGGGVAAQTLTGHVEVATASSDIADIFDRVAPAVVGISARRGRSELYYGSGTILDPTGLVLTSTTVVPKGAEEVTVYLKGGRTVPAKTLIVDEPNELALCRIDDGGAGRPYPFARLGDSGQVELGATALTFGNAFRSIEADDQVSLGLGIVSGFYDLGKSTSESKYSGPAIETSAPLNGGTDGGPLVDGEGRVIGVLSLNYSMSRWLGTAVPINQLKPEILAELSWYREAEEESPAYLGMDLEEGAPGEIRVARVEPTSPAGEAGLKSGEHVEAVRGERPGSVRGLREILRRLRPGDDVRIEVSDGEATRNVELRAWGRY